jgi:aminoglycoside phosphotransferase (APT) family kinase protein
MSPDVIPVRPGEEFDKAGLAEYLKSPLEVFQFPHGHSNLVYLIRAGRAEYVLRRPPLGPVAPKAHDMGREYRVLKAVHPHFPEAPKALAFCEDTSVIGAPFFLMERRHGTILRDRAPANPRRVSETFLDCLIRLHAIDISREELSVLGRPEGFLERQVRGWAGRWYAAQTEPSPLMDEIVAWLSGYIPPQQRPTLIHNDYKLDNVILNAGEERIEAVLDWEMATLGDPLADLGLTLCYWTNPSTAPALTSGEAWYSREEIIARYAEATGRDMTKMVYYEVLGIFKLAVILQQIFFRYQRGQTNDERFRDFDTRVRELIRVAVGKMEQA